MTCARNVPSPTLTKAGSDMSVVSVRVAGGVWTPRFSAGGRASVLYRGTVILIRLIHAKSSAGVLCFSYFNF